MVSAFFWGLTIAACSWLWWWADKSSTWHCTGRDDDGKRVVRRWQNGHGKVVSLRAQWIGREVSHCWYNTETGEMDLWLGKSCEAAERRLAWKREEQGDGDRSTGE